MRAHQLAFVSGQPMRASRAYLAVMIHGRFVHLNLTNHSALRGTRSNLIIENAGPLRKHG
jgi:hypothetical protein